MATNGQTDLEEGDQPVKSSAPRRELWKSKQEFILSCIGLSVGFGNIWRFPYLVYSYGGASFVLIYAIFLFFFGSLLIFFEITLGQFTSVGPIEALNVSRAFRIVGIAGIIINVYISLYYNVIMTYVFFYFYHSFMSPLPWSDCFAWWGATNSCIKSSSIRQRTGPIWHSYIGNQSYHLDSEHYESDDSLRPTTPYSQFWEIYVLNKTDSIYEIGTLKWNLVLPFFISWVIIFLCIFRGINTAGRLVYFTALSPYLLLTILGIFAFLQEGAMKGLTFFFVPEWDKFRDFEMWHRAMEQVLYSIGIAMGSLMAFGSYNKFHEKVVQNSLCLCAMDFLGSILGGFLNFCVIGNLAHRLNTDVDKVVNQGVGLAFVTYPQALSQIYFPNLCSVLFFFMMFLLGIDSQFGMVHAQLTSLYDQWNWMRNFKTRVSLLLCLSYFLLGLIFVTRGGVHVLTLVDSFGGGLPLLATAFLNISTVMWGYGWKRYFRDMEFMQERRFPVVMQAMMGAVLPLLLLALVVVGFGYSDFRDMNGEPYRPGVLAIGLIMATSSVLPPVIYFLATVIFNPKTAFTVNPNFGPKDPDIYRSWSEFISRRQVARSVHSLPSSPKPPPPVAETAPNKL